MPKLFHHTHPYPPFNLEDATKIIVGTLPPPRFTTGDLNDKDVDFCYGSSNGQLWPILNKLFDLGLVYENTHQAIEQRKHFLLSHKIGVCDIVASSRRIKIDASDIGMQDIILRDILKYLSAHQQIDTLLFTGGNSKNGPEYFFRRKAKEYNLTLEVVDTKVPRIHQFAWEGRTIKTVSLTAPSGAANRAVGSMALYKELKAKDPAFNAIDFRVMQYKPFFLV